MVSQIPRKIERASGAPTAAESAVSMLAEYSKEVGSLETYASKTAFFTHPLKLTFN